MCLPLLGWQVHSRCKHPSPPPWHLQTPQNPQGRGGQCTPRQADATLCGDSPLWGQLVGPSFPRLLLEAVSILLRSRMASECGPGPTLSPSSVYLIFPTLRENTAIFKSIGFCTNNNNNKKWIMPSMLTSKQKFWTKYLNWDKICSGTEKLILK